MHERREPGLDNDVPVLVADSAPDGSLGGSRFEFAV